MMRDELIAEVSRAASLPTDQATAAVVAMMRFFTARLPSALVGELHSRLDAPSSVASDSPTGLPQGKLS